MALQTAFIPTPTLPAVITSPPTAQFTPGPGCVDPDDHWVVVTSCYAQAIGEDYGLYPSPDWLTCQLTQFGPVEYQPTSCYVPYSAQTVVDGVTRFYSDCPAGYTGASTAVYSRSDQLRSDVHVWCCPSQYNFNILDDTYMEFITERDGVAYTVGYPLPMCVASYITELSGREIAVRTEYNTYGWEKRQIANVPWDYIDGTMYAEEQGYSYTVFVGTHTCYQDCWGWNDYYFSGGPEPPFTAIDTVPIMTTPVEEPATTPPPSSEGEVGTSPPPPPPPPPPSSVEETTPTEESSSTEEIDEPSTPPVDAQTTTSSAIGEDLPPTTSSIRTTPTPTPSETNGDIASSSSSSSSPPPSSTTSDVPAGAAGAVTPTRLVVLGLFISLIAL